MRIFCSFAYTGEDQAAVEERMGCIVAELEAHGHEVYCNIFDDGIVGFTEPKEFLNRALSVLPEYDIVFVIMTSPRRSEGLLIEVGAALALGKRLIVAEHESVAGGSYVPTLAE